MKNCLYLLVGLFGLASCSTKIESTANWRDITILYGMLNHQDTAHYIVVQKAFLDPDRSGLQIAQITDSLYYPENSITVQLLDSFNNSVVGTFQRVDAAAEGFSVDNSVFNTTPKYLYKLKRQLDRAKAYKVAVNKANGQPTTASTYLIDSVELIPPTLVDMTRGTASLRVKLSSRAKVYEHYFIITYLENGQTKTLRWKFKDFTPEYQPATYTMEYNSSMFYQYLAANLTPMGSGSRQLCKINWEAWSAGPDYYDYVESGSIDLGVTGAFSATTIKSNIRNGFGLLSAKSYSKLSSPITLDTRSMDTLSMGRFTRNLGFTRNLANCP